MSNHIESQKLKHAQRLNNAKEKKQGMSAEQVHDPAATKSKFPQIMC